MCPRDVLLRRHSRLVRIGELIIISLEFGLGESTLSDRLTQVDIRPGIEVTERSFIIPQAHFGFGSVDQELIRGQ